MEDTDCAVAGRPHDFIALSKIFPRGFIPARLTAGRVKAKADRIARAILARYTRPLLFLGTYEFLEEGFYEACCGP